MTDQAVEALAAAIRNQESHDCDDMFRNCATEFQHGLAAAGYAIVPADRSEGLLRLLAAVDALLFDDPEVDPVPEEDWDPMFIELRDARAAISAAYKERDA